MSDSAIVLIVVVLLVLLVLALSIRIVKQYEKGVLSRLGRLRGTRGPGLRIIIPLVDVLHRVSLRIVTLPRQLQGEPDVFDHDEAREAAGGCARRLGGDGPGGRDPVCQSPDRVAVRLRPRRADRPARRDAGARTSVADLRAEPEAVLHRPQNSFQWAGGGAERTAPQWRRVPDQHQHVPHLSLIHISEPTRLGMISYAVFCLKKK